ncbi:ATP-binding cassette domain-containing protein [Streptomyces sp. NPDC056004]|uniref:ATP-binding cassette domain-containing protein n=1 Tax=Streptomyces sp. NPDC056004 TaxID=3345677 RepID=UPI0035D7B48C
MHERATAGAAVVGIAQWYRGGAQGAVELMGSTGSGRTGILERVRGLVPDTVWADAAGRRMDEVVGQVLDVRAHPGQTGAGRRGAASVPSCTGSSARPSISQQRSTHSPGAITLRTPVGRMSQGQQRRLHLAMCLAEQPDPLMLDELTNHLSASPVDELTQALTTTACAVVVATHDRQMLIDLAGRPRLELAGSKQE